MTTYLSTALVTICRQRVIQAGELILIRITKGRALAKEEAIAKIFARLQWRWLNLWRIFSCGLLPPPIRAIAEARFAESRGRIMPPFLQVALLYSDLECRVQMILEAARATEDDNVLLTADAVHDLSLLPANTGEEGENDGTS